jgi:hypothetical protein
MHDFETLVTDLLTARPELAREQLMQRIDDKKRTVGGGYLTDQGALFLVAGELGVSLRRDEPGSDLHIKDLYIGANDVTVLARILSVYPVSTYSKKDGGVGRYRRLVLFEGDSTVRLTVWEDGLDELEKANLTVDMAVRTTGAYVKQGLDGKASLNLGRRGKIVMADDAASERLPHLTASTKRLGALVGEAQFVALSLVVTTEPRYSEFVRADGSTGSLFQFGASGDGGKNNARVVIWSPATRPDLKPGDELCVTNVRSRKTRTGEFEVHGDAGSEILLSHRQSSKLRVVAGASGGGGMVVAVTKDGGTTLIEATDVSKLTDGELVSVVPDLSADGRLTCSSTESIQVVQDDSFPSLEALSTKLRDARNEHSWVMVEVIALSHGRVDEVRLKDGSLVKKGELLVGDETGELKLVGWRRSSEELAGIRPGERLRVAGVIARPTKMGSWVLEISDHSALVRLKETG